MSKLLVKTKHASPIAKFSRYFALFSLFLHFACATPRDRARSRCSLIKGSGAGLVIQGTLFTPDGIQEVEIVISSQGRLGCVSGNCEKYPGYHDLTRLSCSQSIISPGFINAHEHLDYNNAGPLEPDPCRWTHRHGWRKGALREKMLPATKATQDMRIRILAEKAFCLDDANTRAKNLIAALPETYPLSSCKKASPPREPACAKTRIINKI